MKPRDVQVIHIDNPHLITLKDVDKLAPQKSR